MWKKLHMNLKSRRRHLIWRAVKITYNCINHFVNFYFIFTYLYTFLLNLLDIKYTLLVPLQGLVEHNNSLTAFERIRLKTFFHRLAILIEAFQWFFRNIIGKFSRSLSILNYSTTSPFNITSNVLSVNDPNFQVT
jgi:hypothetical protein